MGYTKALHYRGGVEDWRRHGGTFEGQEGAEECQGGDWTERALAIVDRISFRRWLAIWMVMVLTCGFLYWFAPSGHLLVNGEPLSQTLRSLALAIYFSGVTATTLGFGDITPTGPLRFVTIFEAGTGILLFGAVVTKLLSHRQEQLIEDIHALTFEERLGRIHQGLHSLISEIYEIRRLCKEPTSRRQLQRRMDSAVRMLSIELRRVHRLLHHPHQAVDESVLESILASLVSALGEFRDLLDGATEFVGDASHEANLRTIVRTAEEICGDCIPERNAPRLAVWMDAVQEAARQITM